MRLTDKDLMRACCRALYLWEFGDDEVKPKHKLSDKELLNYFANEWQELLKNKKPISYTKIMVDKLIYSCGLRPQNLSNRKRPNINFYFNGNHLAQRYLNSIKTLRNNQYTYARSAMSKLGDELDASKGSRGNIKGYGNQRAFASRILFFAIPQMYFFNYSPTLKEKLKEDWKVKGVEHNKAYTFMNRLLKRYESKIKKLPRPNFASDCSAEIATLIANNNWWERRVLDLAVLENWECFCR
jgi:hypothetical protein